MTTYKIELNLTQAQITEIRIALSNRQRSLLDRKEYEYEEALADIDDINKQMKHQQTKSL
jgi:hypothetical protein